MVPLDIADDLLPIHSRVNINAKRLTFRGWLRHFHADECFDAFGAENAIDERNDTRLVTPRVHNEPTRAGKFRDDKFMISVMKYLGDL